MSDQHIALLTGMVTPIALLVIARVLDYLLPRGRHWRWIGKHSVRDDEEEDDQAAGDQG